MAPVEYAVAVEEYLGQAVLGAASRRIYRISLTGWAWPLVGKQVPRGTARRGAVPPIVPLALLDDPDTGSRLGAAVAKRGELADARTVNREVSALRSAAGWWLERRQEQLGAPAGVLDRLEVLAPKQNRYALGAAPGAGRLAPRWRVILPEAVIDARFEGLA